MEIISVILVIFTGAGKYTTMSQTIHPSVEICELHKQALIEAYGVRNWRNENGIDVERSKCVPVFNKKG